MGHNNRTSLISKWVIEAVEQNKDTILGEVMLGVNFFNKEKGNTPNKRVKQKNSTDKYVRSCPKCDLCWEYTRVIGIRRNYIYNSINIKDYTVLMTLTNAPYYRI